MNLDTRELYLETRLKLTRLGDDKLEALLKELHDEIYIKNDPTRLEYYRLASSVYTKRKSRGTTLIFHLKKFIPI